MENTTTTAPIDDDLVDLAAEALAELVADGITFGTEDPMQALAQIAAWDDEEWAQLTVPMAEPTEALEFGERWVLNRRERFAVVSHVAAACANLPRAEF
jgi:hypothetical protein